MISSHVLDTVLGCPASALAVHLDVLEANGQWRRVASAHTNLDGRASDLADASSLAELRAKFAPTADWSSQEQAGVAGATDETLLELKAANRAYLERFGFLFIVCASGRSAEQLLAALRARLRNDPASELLVAAEEQAKITDLRLDRLEP